MIEDKICTTSFLPILMTKKYPADNLSDIERITAMRK